MNRDEFLARNKSPSTILNYQKAFKKLDSFLESEKIDEETLVNILEVSPIHHKYTTLQKIIDHIKPQVSARVCKEYFNTIYSYLLLKDLPLDERQKRLRLTFPRHSKPRFDGLDRSKIERIYRIGLSDRFSAYLSFLHGAGMRETESLLVTPRMIEFGTTTRVKLPGEITKFNIPRETFLPQIPAQRIQDVIEKYDIGYDETITVESYDPDNSLIQKEKEFSRIRTKAGLDTPDRKLYQQNDISLHSFRSYFTTVFMDNGLDWFGLAITGHTKYMDTYFRKSLDQRIKTFNQVSSILNF